MPYNAHESAIVHPDATIGDDTRIWHFCHVMKGASLGRGCSLGQNVMVGPNVRIGDNVKIQNNVAVYEGVTLEDEVFCGPSMVFTNVNNPRAHVSRKHEFRPTLVKRGATLGANSTIVCGVTVGEYAFVGAGSVVTRDIKPYQLVYGTPARPHGWMSAHGAKLPDPDADGLTTCPESGQRYRLQQGQLHPVD